MGLGRHFFSQNPAISIVARLVLGTLFFGWMTEEGTSRQIASVPLVQLSRIEVLREVLSILVHPLQARVHGDLLPENQAD
jgi:hypothetical protein